MEKKGMEQRHIDEICDFGKVEEYREEVTSIIHSIWAIGVKVWTTYTTPSEISWDNYAGEPHCIRILIHPNTVGLQILWTLLHENGHAVDGFDAQIKNMSPEKQMNREKRAWVIAEKELEKYPRLNGKKNLFENHRDFCLESYRKYFLKKYNVEVQ